MNINTLTNQTEILVNTRLDTLPLTDDLVAIRKTTTQTIKSQSGSLQHPIISPEPQITERIITRKNLDRLCAGEQVKFEPYEIFQDDLIENIRLYGWQSVFHRTAKAAELSIRNDVFTAFLNGEATIKNLVKSDHGNFYAVKILLPLRP
jgi:hypothetical protein